MTTRLSPNTANRGFSFAMKSVNASARGPIRKPVPMKGFGLPGPGSIRAVAFAAASSGVAHAGALRTGNAFEITAWPRVSNVVHSPPVKGSGAIGGGMFCFAKWSTSHASIRR